MTDEQLEKAANGEIEEVSEELTQELEETEEAEETSEEAENEVTEEVEEEEKEETPEEKPPSRRESLRIQKLVSQLKQVQEAPKTPQGLDYQNTLDADPEVVQQLEADRKQVSDQAYAQGIKQAESIRWESRLEIDAPRVESKYPQLDSKSPEFNPAVADAINTWYLSTSGYDSQTQTVANSNVRYADFVEGIMELADEMAGEKVAKTTKNIAKQAASTGLRPDGSSAKRLNLDPNRDPGSMSDEELKAMISKAIPSNK